MSQPHAPCAEIAALLSAGDEEAAAVAIERHLATCAACAEAEHAVERIIARLHASDDSPLDEDLEERLMRGLCGKRGRVSHDEA